MDDKKDNKDNIVNFNDIKNKAREKDVEKIEDYVYGLCYDMSQGKINMADFSRNIQQYMEKNDISQEKMFNIQKELMKRYGIDMGDIEKQMKNMGINMTPVNNSEDYETMRKTLSFKEKYKDKIGNVLVTTYSIKNGFNDLYIYINGDDILLKSTRSINLQDIELNEFLCSYKKVVKDRKLHICICENTGTFEY